MKNGLVSLLSVKSIERKVPERGLFFMKNNIRHKFANARSLLVLGYEGSYLLNSHT